MNIQKDIDKIRQATKLFWEVANDTGINLTCNAYVAPLRGEDKLECEPFMKTDMGDFSFDFSMDTGFTCDYLPHDGNNKTDINLWQYDVDFKRIHSFIEPPQEKSPDTGQSDQGKSVDEIAHNHLTLSEGKEKEDVFINI